MVIHVLARKRRVHTESFRLLMPEHRLANTRKGYEDYRWQESHGPDWRALWARSRQPNQALVFSRGISEHDRLVIAADYVAGVSLDDIAAAHGGSVHHLV